MKLDKQGITVCTSVNYFKGSSPDNSITNGQTCLTKGFTEYNQNQE